MKTNNTRYIPLFAIFILLLCATTPAFAQKKKPGNWKIEQSTPANSYFTVWGSFKTKGVMGWRNVPESVLVKVFNGKNLIGSDMFLDTPGQFELHIDLDKLTTPKITVVISADYYSTIEIRNIAPKDTELEVYTEKTEFRVMPQR